MSPGEIENTVELLLAAPDPHVENLVEPNRYEVCPILSGGRLAD